MITNTKINEWKTALRQPQVLVIGLVLIGFFLRFYYETINDLIHTYWKDPDYVHGFFVPLFSLYLLWYRRDMLPSVPQRGSWWGLVFFGFWAFIVWSGVYFAYTWFMPFSIVPCLAAITLFIGGWQVFLWAWPAIVFLFFIVPLPGLLASDLSGPLQSIGTHVSVIVTQTLGIPSIAQGNQIILRDPPPLGVEEACSGIKMLMLFFTLCVGAAFIMRKPVWERVLIVVSAPPIAVLANVFRITLTAILFEMAHQWPSLVSRAFADKVFHDFAGLLMMPVALLILLGEMTLISKLMVQPVKDRSVVVRETSRGLLGMGMKTEKEKRGGS
ncbi:MAG: exosortase/archaeosortase family protein [Thermoguttaceae bacterium]|jgi:exosortase